MNFALFDDADIGLDEEFFQKLVIAHQQDDDVDTDEEVMNNAVCATINDAETIKAQGVDRAAKSTNNFGHQIYERCANPQDYYRISCSWKLNYFRKIFLI